jgi:hypothetical protein
VRDRRRKDKELGPELIFSGHRTEIERIGKITQFNSKVDTCVVDMKMVYRPNWRQKLPEGKEQFKNCSKSFNLLDKPIWEQHPNPHPLGAHDTYKMGLDEFQEHFFSFKDKEKRANDAKPPLERFNSSVKQTVGETILFKSKSIRTKIADKILSSTFQKTGISLNNDQKVSKQAYFDPLEGQDRYIHSNNANAKKLIQPRQEYPKTYPISTL